MVDIWANLRCEGDEIRFRTSLAARQAEDATVVRASRPSNGWTPLLPAVIGRGDFSQGLKLRRQLRRKRFLQQTRKPMVLQDR